MEYVKLTEENINEVVNKYVDYYNNCEDGCWTYEKDNMGRTKEQGILGSEKY